MSRPFVLSLIAVALAASGGDAFVPQQAPSPLVSSALFAENNLNEHDEQQSQPTRRDVFRTLSVGMITAATSSVVVPSAALANTVVDTDEFGQEVEYDDEEPKGKSEGEKKK